MSWYASDNEFDDRAVNMDGAEIDSYGDFMDVAVHVLEGWVRIIAPNGCCHSPEAAERFAQAILRQAEEGRRIQERNTES